MQTTAEWREWKAVGRLAQLDLLAKEFSELEDKEQQEQIVSTTDEIAGSRKGRDSLAASFYVKTFRHLILEKSPSSYILSEMKSIQETLTKTDDEGMLIQLEGDTRLRLEMGAAILEAFREAYGC